MKKKANLRAVNKKRTSKANNTQMKLSKFKGRLKTLKRKAKMIKNKAKISKMSPMNNWKINNLKNKPNQIVWLLKLSTNSQ